MLKAFYHEGREDLDTEGCDMVVSRCKVGLGEQLTAVPVQLKEVRKHNLHDVLVMLQHNIGKHALAVEMVKRPRMKVEA